MLSETGLTYDDVLIKPKRSRIDSRGDVSICSRIFSGENKENKDIILDNPIISANMDSVTERDMAQAMCDNGGLGIIHRFQSIEDQANQVESVDGIVGGSVGINSDYIKNTKKLLDSGADLITIDVAHGHMKKNIEAVKEIRENYPDVHLMAGNIATYQGAIDLFEAGADVIKVGIGPGSLCTTRIKSGVGIPQFTAVREANRARKDLESNKYHKYKDRELRIVADGGIKKGGDMAKALGAGADAVMVGGLLASCPESATISQSDDHTVARGSASRSAREDNEMDVTKPVEGEEVKLEEGDKVEVIMKRISNGVRSSFSYCGAKNIREFQDRIEFIKVSPTALRRNNVHLEKDRT